MQGVTLRIPVKSLHAHPGNPRKDLGDISELTESIRVKGILQPLTAIPIIENGEMTEDYTVLIGHRRMAAAKAAGLREVPCVIIT
nr:MAG TPA_asm: chromosome partitioning protein [Caudoviricetes sp.]